MAKKVTKPAKKAASKKHEKFKIDTSFDELLEISAQPAPKKDK